MPPNQAMQNRREEVDARLDALEQSHGRLEQQVGSMKRSLDEVTKCKSIVLEGYPGLEEEWVRYVEGQEQPKWRELKGAAVASIIKDTAAHLGIAYPMEQGADDAQRDLISRTGLKELQNMLLTPGLIKNIYCQMKYCQVAKERKRLPKVFTILMTFGHEAMLVASLVRELDPHLRRASGLKVGSEDVGMEPEGGWTRRLMYLDKTRSEREAKKGRGKGGDGVQPKGNKGKAKGKGKDNKGKGKDNKGKGKNQKGAGKGGAAAAAAGGS